MTPDRDLGNLVHLLRNTPVRDLVSAFERGGFVLQRTTRTGGHIYRNPEGRRTVVIHYQRGRDTLTRGTLRNVVENAGWTEEDLQRFGLL